jgi:sec-independent protein translocase protein TatB
MFNIFSWQHIIILVVIALIVVGPKDLPRLMRMAASWVRQGRSMLQGLSKSFAEMTGTEDLNELRAELNAIKRKHPLSSLQSAITSANEPPPRG